MQCKSILVVEDEELIRETLKETLQLEGYNVFTAANGKDALALLKTLEDPCLILLDLMMPVMNGFEFLAFQEKDVMFAPIPVVIVSAFSDQANSLRVKGFVRKPIDLDLLLRFVKQYCG